MAKIPVSDHAIVTWLFLHRAATKEEIQDRLDQLEVLTPEEAKAYAAKGGVPSNR